MEVKDFFAIAAETEVLDLVETFKEHPPRFENSLARQAVSVNQKLDRLITREEWDEFWNEIRRLDPLPDRSNLETLFQNLTDTVKNQAFLTEPGDVFQRGMMQSLAMFKKETMRRFNFPKNMGVMEKHEYHGDRLLSILDDLADIAYKRAHRVGDGIIPIWADVREMEKESIVAAGALETQAEKEATPQPIPEPESKGLLSKLWRRDK